MTVASAERDLEDKPLVEAILEIKWQLTDGRDPAHPLFVGSLAAELAADYPFQERLPAAEIPDELTPYVVKFRVRVAPETWPLVQAGPGIVSLNFAQAYTWNKFRSSARSLWLAIEKVYPKFNNGQTPRMTDLQLRYINMAPLDGESPGSFLERGLHTTISLPAEVSEHNVVGPAQQIAVAATYPLSYQDTNGTVRIQSARQNNTDVIMWDLAVDGKVATDLNLDGFCAWLDYSHQVIEDWFFALIEGELYAQFAGGSHQ